MPRARLGRGAGWRGADRLFDRRPGGGRRRAAALRPRRDRRQGSSISSPVSRDGLPTTACGASWSAAARPPAPWSRRSASTSLGIGAEIDPGVPALVADRDGPLGLALKSGNFGADDFFEKAVETDRHGMSEQAITRQSGQMGQVAVRARPDRRLVGQHVGPARRRLSVHADQFLPRLPRGRPPLQARPVGQACLRRCADQGTAAAFRLLRRSGPPRGRWCISIRPMRRRSPASPISTRRTPSRRSRPMW